MTNKRTPTTEADRIRASAHAPAFVAAAKRVEALARKSAPHSEQVRVELAAARRSKRAASERLEQELHCTSQAVRDALLKRGARRGKPPVHPACPYCGHAMAETRKRKLGPDAHPCTAWPRSEPTDSLRRLSITVPSATAAWIRAEVAREGCSAGDVIHGCVLVVLAADGDPAARAALAAARGGPVVT